MKLKSDDIRSDTCRLESKIIIKLENVTVIIIEYSRYFRTYYRNQFISLQNVDVNHRTVVSWSKIYL